MGRSSSVAWAIGGALVSCIAGATQAAIVKVILANTTTIARALRVIDRLWLDGKDSKPADW